MCQPPSRPYLAAVGAPNLRFSEAVPPPDLSVRPPAGAPPQPAVNHEPDSVSASKPETQAARTEPVAPPQPEVAAKEPASTPPPSILPDDTRPKVRPEDFLPFFQFPGGNSAPGTLTPPAPGQQPLSTATYRQQ